MSQVTAQSSQCCFFHQFLPEVEKLTFLFTPKLSSSSLYVPEFLRRSTHVSSRSTHHPCHTSFPQRLSLWTWISLLSSCSLRHQHQPYCTERLLTPSASHPSARKAQAMQALQTLRMRSIILEPPAHNERVGLVRLAEEATCRLCRVLLWYVPTEMPERSWLRRNCRHVQSCPGLVQTIFLIWFWLKWYGIWW